MKKRFFSCYFLLVILFVIGCGQESGEPYEKVILKETVKDQIYFLASDEMMGRNTGSEEIKEAANYIADYFRKIGVKEFPDAPGYLQEVPMKITEPASQCDLEINNVRFSNLTEFVLRAGEKLETTNEIIYVPVNRLDNQTGEEKITELKGKIVVTELGAGQNSGFGIIMSRSEKRNEIVRQAGGMALIEIYDHTIPWSRLAPYLNRSSMELDVSGGDEDRSEITHIWLNIEDQELIGQIMGNKGSTAKIK